MTPRAPAWLDRMIQRSDWLRRPPSRIGGPPGFKEWMHFCIYADSLDLLVNFSEVDDLRPGPAPRPGLHRLTLLARSERWFGGVVSLPPEDVELHAGSIHLRYGDSSLRWQDGRYHLRVHTPELPIACDLELCPVSSPIPIHNVTVGDGPPIHWVVIPRLLASGTLTLRGRTTTLDRAPAYHDHNWGYFRWGRDFAWEWGFGLPQDPEAPFSLVFSRLSNRALTRTRMQALFLWEGDQVAQAFRDEQIIMRHHGLLRAERVLRVPPVMSLVSPGQATDIPERVTLEARAGRSHLEAEFIAQDVAQVILPNDDDLGVTIINEVAGDLHVTARLGDRRVQFSCRTIFEFLGV